MSDPNPFLKIEEKEIVLQQLNKHFSAESDILILLSDNFNSFYSDSIYLNWQKHKPEKGFCLIMDCKNKDIRLLFGTKWDSYLEFGFSEKLVDEKLCPLISAEKYSDALNLCIEELSENLSEAIIAEKLYLAVLEGSSSGSGKIPSMPFSANPFILVIWFAAILLYLAFGMLLFFWKKKTSKTII